MKKLVALVLLLLVASCAPAPEVVSAPVEYPIDYREPEIATSAPSEPEDFEESLTVRYDSSNIPDELFYVLLETEEVTFTFKEGRWDKKLLSTRIRTDLPLLVFEGIGDRYFEEIAIDNGGYGINSFEDAEGGIYIQPLGITPGGSVIFSYKIRGCDENQRYPMICRVEGTDGYMNFTLDLRRNTFQYSYMNIWDFRYTEWIDETIIKLGYQSVRSDLEKPCLPGERSPVINLIPNP